MPAKDKEKQKMSYSTKKLEYYVTRIESIRTETRDALTPRQFAVYSTKFFSPITDLYLNHNGRVSTENKVKMESASRIGLIFAKYVQANPGALNFEQIIDRTAETLRKGADPRALYLRLEGTFDELVQEKGEESLEAILAEAPCGLKCTERRVDNKNRQGGVWTDENRSAHRRDFGESR